MSSSATSDAQPPLRIRGAALRRGERELWAGLDLDVEPGEFIAVLGPSGSGKTTLLRAILGLEHLSAGAIETSGRRVERRGNRHIGYVPQQRPLPPETALRGRDLVTLGVTGHKFGFSLPNRRDRERVDVLVADVGAEGFADRPVGGHDGTVQPQRATDQAGSHDLGAVHRASTRSRNSTTAADTAGRFSRWAAWPASGTTSVCASASPDARRTAKRR